MAYLLKYIQYRWKQLFATIDAEKFPAHDEDQRQYRKQFGDIVDKYLIYCNVQNDKNKCIVYIDAENDIDWQMEDENEEKEEAKKRLQYIAKLDVVHALSVQNLPEKEVMNFKKILGVGYNAALHHNWEEVDMAIYEAKKYREDRNKERSRFMLLKASTIFLFVLLSSFIFFIHLQPQHPHTNVFSGMVMGVIGSYVSIWMRYGKIDLTGLGSPIMHYLESFSRLVIGAIFAMVTILLLKTGLILKELMLNNSQLIIYCIVGFCSGFSEKLVPTIMEKLQIQI